MTCANAATRQAHDPQGQAQSQLPTEQIQDHATGKQAQVQLSKSKHLSDLTN